MNKLPRFLRHLSFANVISCIALFAALGGVGYAAATINGNAIKQQTIGAGKLKKSTLTSSQVKQNALTGDVIDESTLTIVPSARSAATAQSATTAQSAETANSAASAERAETANTATTANSAKKAQTAMTAASAETLDGLSPENLKISCAEATDFYGGMCWDESPRPIKTWIGATIECGEDGGRLPTIGELIAYIAQPGPQFADHGWSGEVVEVGPSGETAVTADETARAVNGPGVSLGFRCVFPRSN